MQLVPVRYLWCGQIPGHKFKEALPFGKLLPSKEIAPGCKIKIPDVFRSRFIQIRPLTLSATDADEPLGEFPNLVNKLSTYTDLGGRLGDVAELLVRNLTAKERDRVSEEELCEFTVERDLQIRQCSSDGLTPDTMNPSWLAYNQGMELAGNAPERTPKVFWLQQKWGPRNSLENYFWPVAFHNCGRV